MNKVMPIKPLLALAFSLLLTACGSTPSAKFYLLEPSAIATSPSNSEQQIVLVLAPVRIPHYLDRAQIVSASGNNSYQLSELNRWAEGLDHNINRILQQDLSQHVPATVLQTAPADANPLKLAVNIVEFHVTAQGQASLKAQWQLTQGKQLLSVQHHEYLEATTSGDYPKMVAALNACLRQMSGDIAKSVQVALLSE